MYRKSHISFVVSARFRRTWFRAAVCAALCAFFLAGCDIMSSEDPFPDEYYTSNFIADMGFGVITAQINAQPGTDPETGALLYAQGGWDYAYRYVDWDGYHSVSLAAVGEAGFETAGGSGYSGTLPAGLDAAATVYRLELINLLDDGTFEAGNGGVWTPTSNASATRDTYSRVTGAGSMLVSSDGGSIQFVPAFLAGFSPTGNASYNIFFRYPVSPSSAEFNVFTGGSSSALASNSALGIVTGQFIPSADGEALSLTLKPLEEGGSFDAVYLDDFQLSRNDNAMLRLRLGPNDTEPVMEGGTYAFSVWVRFDPTASDSGYPSAYPLNTLVITMKGVDLVPDVESTSDAYLYDPSNTGWQLLSAKLSGNALQYDNPDDDPNRAVLDLVIGLSDSRPGRILLASPSLRFLD